MSEIEDPSYVFREQSRFWIQRVLVPILVCIGAAGNILSVIVLTRRRMRSSTNAYLTALAVADLIYLLFVLLLSFKHYPNINDHKFELYWRFYGISHWLCDAASSTSVWLTVSFTLERYIVVCHPIKGKVLCTERRAKSIIAIVSILCIILTATTPFEYQLAFHDDCIKMCDKSELEMLHPTDHRNNSHEVSWISSSSASSISNCSEDKEDRSIPVDNETLYLFSNSTSQLFRAMVNIQLLNTTCCEKNYTITTEGTSFGKNRIYQSMFYWFSAIVFAVLPLALIATFNCFLVHSVYKSYQMRKVMTNSQEQKSQTQENRITLLLIAIVVLFLICQIPTASVLIYDALVDEADSSTENIKTGLGNIFNSLITLNASCNFILYCLLSDKYRRTCKALFFHRNINRQDSLFKSSRHSFRLSERKLLKRGKSSYVCTPKNLEHKMELKYIVMTIIKILISVPCILMTQNVKVMAASLIGGHFKNNENSSFFSDIEDVDVNQTVPTTMAYQKEKQMLFTEKRDYDVSEEIPDPSALILPGYNLPDNIFNKGKPFYLEKDPVTGKVDFESKTALSNLDEEFDYIDEEPSPDMYAKSNINRKDGSLSSHKQSDVNQLTPNFHDFLNLPVKYNPEKYVYPLISSSYANTKVQGNINKYHNHKDYLVTTYKPNYYTVKTPHFNPNDLEIVTKPTTTSTSTTTTTTTTKRPQTTQQEEEEEVYFTTQNINDVYLTTAKYPVPTTTKRTLSLFEQLFGEYDEIPTTENIKKPPSLFNNLPQNKNKQEPSTTEKSIDFQNILSGSEMGHESAYEYEDDYGNVSNEFQNNTVIFQTKPINFEIQKTPPPSTSTSTTIKTTTTSTTTTKKIPFEPIKEYEYEEDTSDQTTTKPTTTTQINTSKVTSMQLGEKHISTVDSRSPIIAVTHNLREQLNNEKIPKPFNYKPVSNTNSVRILPNQNTVSFVVGNHQHVGGGYEPQYQGSPYDSNPFRPLIVEPENDKDTVSYIVQAKPVFSQSFPEIPQSKSPEIGGSSINIQPIKTSEASLSIGVPINSNKKIPGQVVDENLGNEKIEFPKTGTGAKIVFPDDNEEKISTITPNLLPPPPPTQPINPDILHLNSKPMYHQLPSDLTPPNEQDEPISHPERRRPPWDPRPGHFHNGKPEYLRPPRPQIKPPNGEVYKRIDKLPNILPQFRPNAKLSTGPHYFDNMKNGYMRQPLLERPSNRPILFFEKLMPPPPSKNLHNLRKVPMLEEELRNRNGELKRQEQYEFYQMQTPPSALFSNRRSGNEPTIETLQMIQAKQSEKKEFKKPVTTFKTTLSTKDTTEKPLYVVYPVNSAPIKLDALDSNKKETVVIGTRAELPLPPSKINQEFTYESPQDRNDFPILKPHLKPNYPLKSNFPYPLERPDISPLATTVIGNNLEDTAIESRIVNTKINYKNPNQISVTLKTYTEKPIAIAYTPTEPYRKSDNTEKYSMPNYAGPVISEIRPSFGNKKDPEITVSTMMHAGQANLGANYQIAPFSSSIKNKYIDRSDKEDLPAKLDFEAPFQASVNIDGMTQGWTVVRKTEKSKIDRSDDNDETTTIGIATTSEFDIENFKPELFGGFKPIYNFSDGIKANDSLSGSEERAR